MRWLHWALGEPPPPKPPEAGSAALALWLCTLAALGMELSLRHTLKMDDPWGMNGWRFAVFGALPLWGVALWEAVRLRKAVVPSLIAAPLVLGPLIVGVVSMPTLIADWRLLVVPTLAGTLLAASAWRHLDPAGWGLTLGDWRWWAPRVGIALAVLLPGVALAAWAFPSLVAYYPVWRHGRDDAGLLLYEQSALALDMLGWECLFRGLLLFGLLRRGDWLAAVLVQAFPFFLLHAKKPEPEFVLSWFGGILAGWFCIRARSFFPLWIIHFAQIAWMSLLGFLLRQSIV